MNIVILTNNGSLFGKKVLNALQRRSVPVRAVVVITQPISQHWKMFRYVQRRVGAPQALYFSAQRLLAAHPAPTTWEGGSFVHDYGALASAVYHERGTNSDGVVSRLSVLAPDLLLLGQTGIVRKHILATARIGTLNAHPGILPDYRGIDCALWAVHRGDWDKVGNTLHWVDPGVDTGAIIARKRFVIDRPMTPHALEDALYDEGAMLMATMVQRLHAGEALPSEAQQQGTQYYKMPLGIERAVRHKLLHPPG
jgi:methionyl-tRNA formyltransferase